MAPECMDKYANMHLEDVAKVEQACATGKTPEGKTPKGIVEDMVPLIADRNVPSVIPLSVCRRNTDLAVLLTI